MAESKLGSLFDGSGGFPLAGALNGIKPVWASEIEPFPIRVTKARFPNMKHLGDVTKINGAEIEPVDIITFGSPCQDLSVAGKQLGIHDGERSNLFFEAIRIIKEMREHDRATGRADDDIRPRFAVWENVPGAFSSNKGADFQAVLQAFCNIMEDGLHIPRPKKWNHAGCVAGNGWSLAWRVYDAQYWPGTPQRRKRIYLIADFGSERAGEILFECEGLHGHPAQGGEAGEGASTDAEGSVGGSDSVRCLNPWDGQNMRLHDISGVYPTFRNNDGGGGRCDGVCYSIEGHIVDRQTAHANYQIDVSPTLCSDSHGTPHAVCFQQNSPSVVCAGFRANNGTTAAGTSFVRECVPTIMESILCHVVICFEPGIAKREGGKRFVSDKAMTLRAQEHGHQPIACYAVDCRNMQANEEISSAWKASSLSVFDAHGNGDGEIAPTITGDHENRITDYTAVCVGNGQLHQTDLGNKAGALNCMHDQQAIITQGKPPRKYVVRRLTPLECCRLQGFPDYWTDGVEGSDSAKYKMWGNGIALPCAVDVIGRIAKELRKEE